MDFAKRQLEKYGWKEGKGLGKQENGISQALKANLKFDLTGVGHDAGKDFTYKWWENVYDNAANNIAVEKAKATDEIQVKRVGDEVEITTKDYSVKDFKRNSSLEYGSFLKTSKLTQDGTVNYDTVAPANVTNFESTQIPDDELFKICGGRTAHKGARHGLKLSGKLSRIEKQEKMLLKKLQKVKLQDTDEEVKCKKKLEKLRKQEVNQPEPVVENTDTINKKKKKKRKRKSVSFSETVLQYSANNADDPLQVEVNQIKDKDNDDDPVTTDEGIDPDSDKIAENRGQESFSEMQVHKKEKKKKKKAKAVVEVIDDSNMSDEMEEATTSSKKKKKKKRAQLEVDIDGVKKIKRKKYEHKDIADISDTLEDCRISE